LPIAQAGMHVLPHTLMGIRGVQGHRTWPRTPWVLTGKNQEHLVQKDGNPGNHAAGASLSTYPVKVKQDARPS